MSPTDNAPASNSSGIQFTNLRALALVLVLLAIAAAVIGLSYQNTSGDSPAASSETSVPAQAGTSPAESAAPVGAVVGATTGTLIGLEAPTGSLVGVWAGVTVGAAGAAG